MRSPLSVVLLVKNEADRLGPSLESVAWADELVVADTGSTDGTRELAERYGARILGIPWEGYVGSRNLALGGASHDWVLFLDADEQVPEGLAREIREVLESESSCAGYSMPRLSHFLGRPIRHGTWYPDRKLRLGRRSKGFRAEGGRVHEWLVVDGLVGQLAEPLLHFPYRSLSDVLRKASDYARLGALDRYDKGLRGSVFGLVGRPIFEFIRCYLLKRGFLDGRAGFGVAFFHAASYFLRAAYLLDLARAGSQSGSPGGPREEVPS